MSYPPETASDDPPTERGSFDESPPASDKSLTEHEFPTDPPSRAVVRAVAERTDRSATDLPPLGDVLDAGALDALLDSPPGTAGLTAEGANATAGAFDADGDDAVRISFSYAGYRVTALSGGTVLLAAEPAE